MEKDEDYECWSLFMITALTNQLYALPLKYKSNSKSL